jgi:hypothetical protein
VDVVDVLEVEAFDRFAEGFVDDLDDFLLGRADGGVGGALRC